MKLRTHVDGTTNLLGMDRDELRAFVADLGERPYRGDQLFRWLYTRGAERFAEMTDIAQASRQRLQACASLAGVALLEDRLSPADGTTKFRFGLADGLSIESVLIPPSSGFEGDEPEDEDAQAPRERLSLCVSTQVGCPLDCAFCATGTMGFVRNLTPGEIVGQVLAVRRLTGRTITNVVFMGMGEPMLNYDAVMRTADLLTEGMAIAARRITVSTAGWVPGIRRMAEERRRMKLAVSLHSAVEQTRAALMPVAQRYPLAELQEALRFYYRRVRRRITVEHVFFDGINDTPLELRRLIAFARDIPSKINVIPYHSIAFAGPQGFAATLRPSPRLADIVAELRRAHLTVMVRSSAGEDIAAACGQLVVTAPRRRRRSPGPDGPPADHDQTGSYENALLWPAGGGEGDAGKTAC